MRDMLKTLNLSIAVLKMFTKEKPTWGGRELALAMNMNHTNLYRILETFENNGFITKDPITKKYSLGIALWEIGMNMYDSLNIDQLCMPVLEKLKDVTGETAIFTVLNGLEAAIDKFNVFSISLILLNYLSVQTAANLSLKGEIIDRFSSRQHLISLYQK